MRAGPSTTHRWWSRARVHAFVWSASVQNAIIAVILVNAVVLGLQTSRELVGSVGGVLSALDTACVVVYVIEIGLKLYADRFRFFRSGWNVFDFVIVAVALIPGSESIAVLRALRVLRILRLISVVPALRRVVDGLARAVPGIASVGALLLILFYVGAVMATTLFGERFPELFGSLGTSLFTLFQLMTLDNWSVISRTVMEVYPFSPIFFVIFVFVSAITVLNLVVAVIVDGMQQAGAARERAAGRIPGVEGDSRAADTASAPAASSRAAPDTTADGGSPPGVATAHDIAALAAEIAGLRAEVARLSASPADPADC